MIRLFFILLVAWACTPARGEVPPLERLVSLDVHNERLPRVLQVLSQRGNFNFSYHSALISENRLVTLRATNVSVREALNQLFKGTLQYHSRGNHIVLRTSPEPDTEETPKHFYLEGYITDEHTGHKITQVSVYEKTTFTATLTDAYGFYRIKLPTSLPQLLLEIRKQEYVGETVRVRSRQSHTLNIRLAPFVITRTLPPLPIRQSTDTSTRRTVATPQIIRLSSPDSVPRSRISLWKRSKNRFTDWLMSTKSAIHDSNLSGDTLYRQTQVSVLPFVGSNATLSARAINDLSYNVLLGYSLGVNEVEIGGLGNVVRGNVHGVQVAGMANLVGERVEGTQLAGMGNIIRRDMRGFQGAGIGNIIGGDLSGVQLAGVGNLLIGSLHHGVQLSGVANLIGGESLGTQVAGVGNIRIGPATGVQLAGVLNIATSDLNGWQLSSALNYSRHITGGHQIGLLNMAGYAEKAPYGLFSYVHRNGYRRLEISINEASRANLTFKTGHRGFYNILTIGSNLDAEPRPAWSFGYGFGTAVDLKKGWMLNVDYTTNFRLPAQWQNFEEGRFLGRFELAVEKKISRGLALAVGPTFNLSSFDADSRHEIRPTYSLPAFSAYTLFPDFSVQGWVGFHVGLRICNRK
ncbi:hypothetical protein BWI97_22460 [Siphonobacter sp. BAB-5405]|uniref:STN and carboxypeptidase regulatory-like domain-containing protein n=1 Tax=Siphonobacter sp. BAB-5405 TaxID=1864825 RepID=UPI000C805095|nr:STN and carboxypeptidase regulatory-like domain-containing protein [Siphonobacter sp. BAB-5405]PMD90741.1 hypothetical protein BWI97_22460 [Siphonobacter sp. BAB-5405]